MGVERVPFERVQRLALVELARDLVPFPCATACDPERDVLVAPTDP